MAQKLSNLSVGAKVKFGRHSVNGEPAKEIIWRVVAKSHSGYPNNSVTIWTENIIDMRCFDAREGNGSDRHKAYGNEAYNVSNLAQWLNSDMDAGKWYRAAHATDAPPSSTTVTEKTEYESRPGFLNLFTPFEKAALLTTTLYTGAAPNGNQGGELSQKVFLPSTAELNLGETAAGEGSSWGSYGGNPSYLTWEAYYYSPSTTKPNIQSYYWEFWTRSAPTLGSVYAVGKSGEKVTYAPYTGYMGVRPAANLPNTLSVSDTTDGDGCYTFLGNTAPNKPVSINPPATIYGGKSNAVSWSATTDPEGDSVTYQLECSTDGGAYTQIYSGASTNYAHLVPFGTSTVQYRVRATDPSGESSEYTTSNALAVVNNNSPVISGEDGNLGVKSSGFLGTYTITDANNDPVTVTESIDGVAIRTLVATLGSEIEYGVDGTTWLALANGIHTLTIRATDGIDTSVRTYTFTKLVETLSITSPIMEASQMPTRIMIVVTRNIPVTAQFKVEVCNDAWTGLTWEDVTPYVENGLAYTFSNTTNLPGAPWAVQIRVTVNRNGATGACYVSAIGGNFE